MNDATDFSDQPTINETELEGMLAEVEALSSRIESLDAAGLARLQALVDQLDPPQAPYQPELEAILAEVEAPLRQILTVSLVPQEGDDWIFTFGPAHHHPETGARLADSYVRFRGTSWADARRRMWSMFRDRWSHQSPGSDAEMLGREYGTTELPESAWPTPKAGA